MIRFGLPLLGVDWPVLSRVEQCRAEQSRAEQSRAEQCSVAWLIFFLVFPLRLIVFGSLFATACSLLPLIACYSLLPLLEWGGVMASIYAKPFSLMFLIVSIVEA